MNPVWMTKEELLDFIWERYQRSEKIKRERKSRAKSASYRKGERNVQK